MYLSFLLFYFVYKVFTNFYFKFYISVFHYVKKMKKKKSKEKFVLILLCVFVICILINDYIVFFILFQF